MAEEQLSISSEEVIKTTRPVRKRSSKKTPNSKFYNYLIQCLEEGKFKWMLYYVPNSNKKQFIVISTDRKNRNWKEHDIALFEAVDEHLGRVFNRKRSSVKYAEAVKTRFKGNMCKCKRFIKELDTRKREGGKTEKQYEILWCPPPSDFVGDSTGNDGNDGKPKKKFYRKKNKMVTSSSKVQTKTDKAANKEKRITGRVHSGAEELKFPESEIQSKSQMIGNDEINLKGDFKNQNISFEGNHEISRFASVTQEDNSKMHPVNICEENNDGFSIFCEEADRDALQNNNFAVNSEIIGNDEINLKGDFKNQNISFEGNHEISRFASVTQEDNSKMHPVNICEENNDGFLIFCEEADRDALQNNNFALNTESIAIDQGVYPDLKIGNIVSHSFTITNSHTQPIINDSDKNLDFHTYDQNTETNISVGNLNAYTCFEYATLLNEQYDLWGSELNEKILKSDPLLSSMPEGNQESSNSLGSHGNWYGTYQELQPLDLDNWDILKFN